LGGSGVHNYFLQTFVELGPVALILVLLLAIPVVRMGKQNLGLVSFYGLCGIAVGNVFAHSLLVRETLILAAVLGGLYLWECYEVAAGKWLPPRPNVRRVALWIAATFALIGLVEVARSFGQAPFVYGARCFEQKPIAEDGWTSGLMRQPVPATATNIDFGLTADRPDLTRRPLAIELSLLAQDGATLWHKTLDMSRPDAERQRIAIDLPGPPSKGRVLQVKTSHCFVPLNLGLRYDPRRLGVRVQDLRFSAEGGAAVN
jgi:hypothetical protein